MHAWTCICLSVNVCVTVGVCTRATTCQQSPSLSPTSISCPSAVRTDCPPCAPLKCPPAPALSACLGLPRQRPRHTNGVKRPAAVLCLEAPEGLFLDRTHQIPSSGEDPPAGHLPRIQSLPVGAEPRPGRLAPAGDHPLLRAGQPPTVPPPRLITCGLRAALSETAPQRRHVHLPGVERAGGVGTLSGELRVSSRPAHPLPSPPAPSADVLGLACLFFFSSKHLPNRILHLKKFLKSN